MDDYERAIAHLLAIVRRERDFAGQNVRRGSSAIFDILDHEHPLTRPHRKEVLDILH